jgi:hypothetical protein
MVPMIVIGGVINWAFSGFLCSMYLKKYTENGTFQIVFLLSRRINWWTWIWSKNKNVDRDCSGVLGVGGCEWDWVQAQPVVGVDGFCYHLLASPSHTFTLTYLRLYNSRLWAWVYSFENILNMKFIQLFYGLGCPALTYEREYELYIGNTDLIQSFYAWGWPRSRSYACSGARAWAVKP